MHKYLFAILLTLLFTPAWSQQSTLANQGPDIRIIYQDNEQLIEEYSSNGNVDFVKVTPQNAPPYYLVPTNNAGEFTRIDDIERVTFRPQWVITNW